MPLSTEREAKLNAAKRRALELMEVVRKEHDLSGVELMTLLAFMTGAALAGQDQRTMTPDAGMELIHANVIAGNVAAVAAFLRAPGGRA